MGGMSDDSKDFKLAGYTDCSFTLGWGVVIHETRTERGGVKVGTGGTGGTTAQIQ